MASVHFRIVTDKTALLAPLVNQDSTASIVLFAIVRQEHVTADSLANTCHCLDGALIFCTVDVCISPAIIRGGEEVKRYSLVLKTIRILRVH